MRSHALPRRPVLPTLARMVPALFRALRLHRSRRSLLALEPHLLRDIGLTPEQAAREALRPLWDAPDVWRNKD